MESTNPDKLEYIKPLDGIRSLAILLVIVWHYFTCQIDARLFGGYANVVLFFTRWTWSGVDLFFVLSGFLIGRILIHSRESDSFFSTFYVRRVARILPPYYLVISVLFVLISTGMSRAVPWLTDHTLPVWTYLSFLQNFWIASHDFGPHWMGVTWSLAIEEQFYLLLPWVIYVLEPRQLPKVLIAGIVLAPIFRMNLSGLGPYVLLPARMDALLLGVLIASYERNGKLLDTFKDKQKLLAWWMGGLFISLMIYRLMSNETIGGVGIHSIMAAMYGVMVIWALILKRGTLAERFLSSRPMAFIARISYMIYLTHQIFSGLAHGLLKNQIPQILGIEDALITLLALVATVLFSAASYRYLEKPIIGWGKKYHYS